MHEEIKRNLKVSGNIISEMSDKIHNHIIALNELIKNAYDACAKNVTINIDSSTNKMYVIDDGDGMSLSEIEGLLHISKSKKNYAQKNRLDRYIQGSKGLGFLSVFKFGRNVTWYTKQENSNGFKFTIDYNELIECDDLSKDYFTKIVSDDKYSDGTTIEINLDQDDEVIYTLSKQEIFEKIVNSFTDNSFNIHLNINGNLYPGIKKEQFKNELANRQFLYIEYDSSNNLVNYLFPIVNILLNPCCVKVYEV